MLSGFFATASFEFLGLLIATHTSTPCFAGFGLRGLPGGRASLKTPATGYCPQLPPTFVVPVPAVCRFLNSAVFVLNSPVPALWPFMQHTCGFLLSRFLPSGSLCRRLLSFLGY